MKLKTGIVIIFFLVIIYNTNAQYSIAGSTVGLYTDVPDTIFTSITNSYYIDINQDGTNDLRIIAAKQFYPPNQGGGYVFRVGASSIPLPTSNVPLDSNVVKFSVAYKCNCFNINMLKSYGYGDTIKKSDYVALGTYLAYDDNYCAARTFSSNAYIGVRYATNIDTAYGWIGVDVLDYGTVRIKDFALEKNPVVGLHELSANNVRVITYPNPAQTQLYIQTEAEISEIKILNVTGSELINTTQKNIDVSSLPNGIYFAQIKTDKGVGARKIVVQR